MRSHTATSAVGAVHAYAESQKTANSVGGGRLRVGTIGAAPEYLLRIDFLQR